MKHGTKYMIDFAALALLYVCVFFRRWKSRGRDRLLVNTLLYIYLSFVLYFTLMPVLTSLPYVLNHPYRRMNMVIFTDAFISAARGKGGFSNQVLLNIIMTVPFGILFPFTRGRNGSFVQTAFFCLLLTLGIELIQPFFNRFSDINDVIANTLGGIIGYVFYLLSRPIVFWILDHLKKKD